MKNTTNTALKFISMIRLGKTVFAAANASLEGNGISYRQAVARDAVAILAAAKPFLGEVAVKVAVKEIAAITLASRVSINRKSAVGGRARKMARTVAATGVCIGDKYGSSDSYRLAADGRIECCYNPARGYNPNPWGQGVDHKALVSYGLKHGIIK